MLNGSAPASGPTLLPDPVASMVSLISKSTSISIRIGSMVGNVLLDTARASTMTSLELSRAAVEGIVRRGSQGVVARRGRDVELDGWASKGVSDAYKLILHVFVSHGLTMPSRGS